MVIDTIAEVEKKKPRDRHYLEEYYNRSKEVLKEREQKGLKISDEDRGEILTALKANFTLKFKKKGR